MKGRVSVSYRGRGAVPLDPGTAVRYRTAQSHTGGQRYAVRILSPGLAVVPRGAVPRCAVRTAGVAVPLPQEMPNTGLLWLLQTSDKFANCYESYKWAQ
jgi:hypothetical protein